MNHNPQHPGMDGRARESNGQTEHRQSTTKIKHLREHYGAHFANGWDGESTLGELLNETRFTSLSQYVEHFRHKPLNRGHQQSRPGSQD